MGLPAAGGAPLFFGPRALEKLRNRKTKPASYNLDLNLIGAQPGLFQFSWLLVPLNALLLPASFLRTKSVICTLEATDRLAALHVADLLTCLAGLSWKRTMCMVRADVAAAVFVRPCLLHITGDYWGWFGSRSYHHTGMVSLWYASEDPVFARLIVD